MSVPTLVQAQSVEELFRQGTAAQTTGDYVRAESIFRQVIRLDPEDNDAYIALGHALGNQGRYEESEAALREALRLDPEDAIAHNFLGIALFGQRRYGESEAAFQEAIRLDPDYVRPYSGLGSALYFQDRYGESEAALREALRLAPHNDLDHYFLGHVLMAQGRYGESEAAYREALRLDPTNVFAHIYLGSALSDQDRYEEAEAAYREALRLDPDEDSAYTSLGNLYQTQDRLEEAIALYNQALGINPDSTNAQNNLAEAERLLALRNNPLPSRDNDLAWQPQNEPLQPILRSVVRVVTLTDTGVKYGTGWVVKREGDRIWVLTNRHVVTQTDAVFAETRAQTQAGRLSDAVEIDLFSEPPVGRTWFRLPAEVVEAVGPSDDIDLALLVIDNAPEDVNPLDFALQSAGLDTDVRVIGHHNDPWSLARGYVNRRPQGTVLQLAETAIGTGSSGSPILNEENQVIGIITSIAPPNLGRGGDFLGGFSYGHPASILLETLKSWNIL